MNAGLSNLATLKAHLLAPALAASTDYDARIATVGQAVLGLFEQHTGRIFAYAAGEAVILSGRWSIFILERLPIQTITTIEARESEGDDWVTQTEGLDYFSAKSGVVKLSAQLTAGTGQIRVTYTGGFWWEQLEPTDFAYPSTMPTGATPLPPALQAAWLLQCEHTWRQLDKLGTAITEAPPAQALPPINLIPAVERQLAAWRVYSL
jgi:hypothetical protein